MLLTLISLLETPQLDTFSRLDAFRRVCSIFEPQSTFTSLVCWSLYPCLYCYAAAVIKDKRRSLRYLSSIRGNEGRDQTFPCRNRVITWELRALRATSLETDEIGFFDVKSGGFPSQVNITVTFPTACEIRWRISLVEHALQEINLFQTARSRKSSRVIYRVIHMKRDETIEQ